MNANLPSAAAYLVQMLEGLLIEAERWSEDFDLLRGNLAACARVMDAYVAWLLAQHRPLDAYSALRYIRPAFFMRLSRLTSLQAFLGLNP